MGWLYTTPNKVRAKQARGEPLTRHEQKVLERDEKLHERRAGSGEKAAERRARSGEKAAERRARSDAKAAERKAKIAELQLRVEERKAKAATGESEPPFVREAIPERVRHEVWRRDEGRCVECGSRARLEFDHIIPVSQGGSNTTRNLELRCEACNRRKGATI